MNNSTDQYGMNDISNGEIYFNAVFLSIVMMTTIIGNSIALHAFIISPELKKITYYFIASLCISDLMVALFSISFWIIDLLSRWSNAIPREVKLLYNCVDIFGGTWSIMSLSFISIERFICIKYALHYMHIMTLRRVYILFFFLFFYCSLVTVLNQNHFEHEDATAHAVKQFSIVFMAFILPVFIKIFTYTHIYLEAKKQTKQINELRRFQRTLSEDSSDMESSSKSSENVRNLNAGVSMMMKRESWIGNTQMWGKKHLPGGNSRHKSLAKSFICFSNCFHRKSKLLEESMNSGMSKDSSMNGRDMNGSLELVTDPCVKTETEGIGKYEDYSKNENTSNLDTSLSFRNQLKKGKSFDCSSNKLRSSYQSTRPFSSEDYGKSLDPNSALMDLIPEARLSQGSPSPLMKRFASISKWSPTNSPLFTRKVHKKSNEQKRNEQKMKRFKKELRAAKVVALIMGAFLICWTPFNILMVLYAFHVNIRMRYIMVAKLLHYLNSSINPLLYVILNKVYRSAVLKVLRKIKRTVRC